MRLATDLVTGMILSRDILSPVFPDTGEATSQDAAQSFAAVSTVVGKKRMV